MKENRITTTDFTLLYIIALFILLIHIYCLRYYPHIPKMTYFNVLDELLYNVLRLQDGWHMRDCRREWDRAEDEERESGGGHQENSYTSSSFLKWVNSSFWNSHLVLWESNETAAILVGKNFGKDELHPYNGAYHQLISDMITTGNHSEIFFINDDSARKYRWVLLNDRRWFEESMLSASYR